VHCFRVVNGIFNGNRIGCRLADFLQKGRLRLFGLLSRVDLVDLNNVRNFFGATAPQPVPEPATFVIACVAFASVGFAVRTRKKSVRQ
jgi:hypothetical protein